MPWRMVSNRLSNSCGLRLLIQILGVAVSNAVVGDGEHRRPSMSNRGLTTQQLPGLAVLNSDMAPPPSSSSRSRKGNDRPVRSHGTNHVLNAVLCPQTGRVAAR